MKNPFARLLHHYTYNLKLKNKLVISHAILLMVPTAVVTGFLYARMYGIVMDDHHPLRAGPGPPRPWAPSRAWWTTPSTPGR